MRRVVCADTGDADPALLSEIQKGDQMMHKPKSVPAAAALAAGLVVAVVASSAASSALARSAAVPVNGGQPQVSGTLRVGQTLTTSTGLWSNGPTSYRYQWLRCDSVQGTNCGNIANATSQNYKLVKADAGHAVLAYVRACNASGCARFVNSKAVGPIAGNVVPQSVSPPTIAGKPVAGEQLTANPGSWTGLPDSYSYQWYQCDPAGAACATVSGATGQVFTARNEDVGKTIRVRVAARNPRGSNAATSAQTDLIAQPTGNTASVPVASVSLPNRLNVSASFLPTVVRTGAPFTARFTVTEAKGRTVSGALVYAIALPYGLVRPAGEVQTGADGTAILTFTPTKAFPKRAAVQFFVRVRKPGENVLAGVSNRRLVQVLVRR